MAKKRYTRKSRKIPAFKTLFLIVCEGELTEKDYFESFPYFRESSYYKHYKIIGVGKQYDHVVTRAYREYEKMHTEEQLEIKPENVFCVFDNDNNDKKLKDTIEIARKYGFNPIYSVQCFELWYILHFNYLQSSIEKERYDKIISKKLGINYTHSFKGMYDLLEDMQDNAIKYSIKLYKERERNNELFKDPVTNIFMLVEAINKANEKHQNR